VNACIRQFVISPARVHVLGFYECVDPSKMMDRQIRIIKDFFIYDEIKNIHSR
jgi:hypothetical protein